MTSGRRGRLHPGREFLRPRRGSAPCAAAQGRCLSRPCRPPVAAGSGGSGFPFAAMTPARGARLQPPAAARRLPPSTPFFGVSVLPAVAARHLLDRRATTMPAVAGHSRPWSCLMTCDPNGGCGRSAATPYQRQPDRWRFEALGGRIEAASYDLAYRVSRSPSGRSHSMMPSRSSCRSIGVRLNARQSSTQSNAPATFSSCATLGARMDRHAATRRLRHRGRHADASAHAAAHLREHRARRRCQPPRRPDRVRHADPRTAMRYDRARKNLDRHPDYILAPSWRPERGHSASGSAEISASVQVQALHGPAGSTREVASQHSCRLCRRQEGFRGTPPSTIHPRTAPNTPGYGGRHQSRRP